MDEVQSPPSFCFQIITLTCDKSFVSFPDDSNLMCTTVYGGYTINCILI
uniref:CSON010071 protein n=1 Tax=Culicoides sonorensis TaxID=179676 RepID=A0A336M3V0_CULSO